MPDSQVIGLLDDGTRYYAPLGRVLASGDRVCCHLCGRWFLSVASHLRVHGWSKEEYVDAFGLEQSNALRGEATRKRRAAAMAGRQIVEPAIVEAQRIARDRARSGALTAAAVRARAGPSAFDRAPPQDPRGAGAHRPGAPGGGERAARSPAGAGRRCTDRSRARLRVLRGVRGRSPGPRLQPRRDQP